MAFAWLTRNRMEELAANGRRVSWHQAQAEVNELWRDMDEEDKERVKEDFRAATAKQPKNLSERERNRRRQRKVKGPYKWHILNELTDGSNYKSYVGAEADFQRRRRQTRIQMVEELEFGAAELGDLFSRRWFGLVVVPFAGVTDSTFWETEQNECAELCVPAEICLFSFSLAGGIVVDDSLLVWSVAPEEEADPVLCRQLHRPDPDSAAALAPWLAGMGTRRFSAAALPAAKVARELADALADAKLIHIAAAEWNNVLGAMQWLQLHLPSEVTEALPLADAGRFRCLEDTTAAVAAYAALPHHAATNGFQRWGLQARSLELRFTPDPKITGFPRRCDLHQRRPQLEQFCATAPAARLVHAASTAFARLQDHGPPPPVPKIKRSASRTSSSTELCRTFASAVEEDEDTEDTPPLVSMAAANALRANLPGAYAETVSENAATAAAAESEIRLLGLGRSAPRLRPRLH